MAPFDWSQYLLLAQELSSRSEESALRSAISRAYYPAYNTAKIFCEGKEISIGVTGNLHRDLWTAFLRRGGRTFTSIYDKGERLRRKRTKADYEIDVPGLSSMTEDSMRDAEAMPHLTAATLRPVRTV